MTTQTKTSYGDHAARKLPSGSWNVRVHLPPLADGTYPRKSFTAKKLSDARKQADAYLKSIQLGVDVEAGTISLAVYLSDFLKKYMSKKERQMRPLANGTRVEYERAIKVLTAEVGDAPLNRLLPTVIESAIWSRGASPDVARKRYTVLNLALKEALYENLIEVNVLDRVERPVGNGHKKPVILTPEEIATIFAEAEDTRFEIALRVQLMVGCRIGELLALKWSDVDMEKSKVTIQRSIDRYSEVPSFKPVKNYEARTVEVTSEVLDILRKHRQNQRLQKLRTLAWNDEDLIFPSATGSIWLYSNYRRDLQPIIASSGVSRADGETVGTHSFRHACAAILLTSGIPLAQVSKFLGHQNIRTTDQYYGHLLEDTSEAASVMSKFLSA